MLFVPDRGTVPSTTEALVSFSAGLVAGPVVSSGLTKSSTSFSSSKPMFANIL